ncbi:hypothetical protein NBT05_00330 [Aquimarina sp. ERC-38]|uniref:hypothetical protein n=1 Tax=Aquimarina sp. ERC-38 TaxID=2949996 RepID=UPI002245B747|nr:hypothetical protein [Aquimarina sp. ERC-38]UZO80947.1 hypothetical protein NBT05_00330 [Aquimarina sp. ERC-38]
MRKITSILFLLSLATSFAQKLPIKVNVAVSKMGDNKISNSDIKGTEYIFHERIENLYLDVINQTITVQTRGVSKNGKWLNNKGQLIQYDINKNNLLWSKKFLYNMSSLKQENGTLLISRPDKTFKINPENGRELLKIKDYIYYLIGDKDIALSYKIKTSGISKDELKAIPTFKL